MDTRRHKTYDAIKAVQFTVLSAREIQSGSVADITTHESTENKGGQTYNKMGGLYDPRLGTITRGVPCLTCNQAMDTCPGHFGATALPTPFFHPEFMLTVMLIFRSICLCCCKPRLPHSLFGDNIETSKYFLIEDPRVRLLELSKNSPKRKNCALCYQYLPAVSKINDKFGWTISCEGRNDDNTTRVYEVTATIAHRILCNITPDVAKLLGFDTSDPRMTRPEDLIWSVMAIPPPQLRPLITFDPMNKGQDDTTTSLYNILKSSSALQEATWASSEDNVRKCSDILSFQLRAMVNNDEKKKPCALQRSGRPLVGTKQRLEGKEGRFRGNLMGKRVDFSARTVITPDPNLDLDEVGVPYDICKNLTAPECVTIDNIHFLQRLVNAGPHELLGANYVERRLLSGALEKIDLSIKRMYVLVINVGDIVHRHLMDIDYILFNRQPSLHKMSMMGHRVRPLPGGTFRLNQSVTTPYNADFDGDEMNLHASQSIAAHSETIHLMHVPKHIITPQSNRPIISLVQDTLLSCPILTSRSALFTSADVYRMFQKEQIPPCVHLVIPAILYPRRLYTGKQVFSMLIPYTPEKSVTLRKFSSVYPDTQEPGNYLFSPTDSQVYIYNSMLICGILDKQTLGSSDGSLIHVLTLQFSNDHTARFINSVQRVTDVFMQMHGYSIGVDDMVIPDDLQDSIKTTIQAGYDDVSGVIGKYSTSTDSRALIDMENSIAVRLGQVRDVCGRLVQQNMTMTRGNSIVNMVNSGSKGSSINISQIMACVGPQEVLGKRIQLSSDGRSLPYFHRGSLSPESRGMVKSPFIYGLSVSEFYYHMMAGREGMIDTAVKTSETGYIQRRLFKSMEALIVQYDGTVRNAQGKIIQYSYGDDAMNAIYLESVNCVLYGITDAAFNDYYVLDNQSTLFSDHLALLRHDTAFVNSVLPDRKVCMPFCIPRLIAESVSDSSVFDIDAAITQLYELETKLAGVGWGDTFVNANQISLIMVYVRSELSPKRAIAAGVSGARYTRILDSILRLYTRALIEPGESVGGLAAQSIGEPATQMTLNTFHFAGVASQSQVTTGVPRLNEIINLSRKFQTPSMKIKLKMTGDPELDILNAQKFQHSVGILLLRDYVKDYQTIVGGPFDVPDQHLQLFFADDMNTLINLCGCYGKILVSAVPLIVSGVSIHDIASSIYDLMNDKVLIRVVEIPPYITHKYPETCHELFVYFPNSNFAPTDNVQDIIHTVLDNIINNITVTGLQGITRVFPAKDGVVETCGVNMTSIFANENVDYAHTTTNDIYVVYEELGIEAARACILRELQAVLTFGGKYVNIRHLSLLVDTMCNSGLMSITRHGMNRKKSGVFMRASFEETLSVLVSAAIFSEKDCLADVTSNIIMGKLSRIGTGFFDVLLDTETVLASAFLSDLSDDITQSQTQTQYKRQRDDVTYSPSRDTDYCPYSPSYSL